MKSRFLRAFGVRSVPGRLRTAISYSVKPMRSIVPWVRHSREFTNFTYDLEPLNERYLAAFVSAVCGRHPSEAQKFIEELHRDGELESHIRDLVRSAGRELGMDEEARFGRRAGWYAIVRLLRPRVVVETGVDKGLGTCVLAAALMKNAAEGFAGRVYGTDINPHAGFLLQGRYREYGEILYGDSIASLRAFSQPIDLFINDSDHSVAYEAGEYEGIRERLAPGAVILGDNAHCNDRLLQFALQTGRRFLFFKEEPANHWYPGGGIGAAFRETGSK